MLRLATYQIEANRLDVAGREQDINRKTYYAIYG